MLSVRNVICKSECLNKFVTYLVSLPVYVKVVHLRSCSFFRGWGGEHVECGREVGRSC